ncbi:formyltetrahydrofolate deformylase [Advenella faeciporci]|uniref:Formyltetrahydrofolate deformylase n=2 Tax=Advenella faeciporci TaxID=797535 RepID=A0A918JMF6_9BURK|nr:formyltetrahydrofolate deformylase [Advenella faeciporci]
MKSGKHLTQHPINMQKDYILTVSCPDRTGIVHAISGFLLELNGNILDSQQFGDEETRQFFLRVHFSLETAQDLDSLKQKFTPLGEQFNMNWNLYSAQQKARILIMVSKQGHCLNDLLFRAHHGSLPVDIVGIGSNHRDYESLAASYGIPFHYLPITPETKPAQEQQIIQLVEDLNVDLVVLARYMQILSDNLCQALQGRAINIHHSFLPSFKGARPYHQAHARGVKIIGATAHYVTADLDEGPIIEQDIQYVDHTMTADDLAQVGSDTESLVLSRAVKHHVEHRILLNGHKTVIFK